MLGVYTIVRRRPSRAGARGGRSASALSLLLLAAFMPREARTGNP